MKSFLSNILMVSYNRTLSLISKCRDYCIPKRNNKLQPHSLKCFYEILSQATIIKLSLLKNGLDVRFEVYPVIYQSYYLDNLNFMKQNKKIVASNRGCLSFNKEEKQRAESSNKF